jgi:DeoR family glycerol-3-phosphate regulon repressor
MSDSNNFFKEGPQYNGPSVQGSVNRNLSQHPKQGRIMDLVSSHGYMSIEALADHFSVTSQTVRRWVNELCNQDILRRYHGGVGLPSSVENVAYATRQVMCLEEKRRIARLVAQHIPEKASIILNIGTTTEEVARGLCGHVGLKVITNNLNVAQILSQKDGLEVNVAGGMVRARDGGIIGPAAMAFIQQFKVDFGIIGISSIDTDGDLLDYDYNEVNISRTIIKNSRQVFLVADHTKFVRKSIVRMAHISEVDALFTDRLPSDAMQAVLKESGVEVYVAEEQADGHSTPSTAGDG